MSDTFAVPGQTIRGARSFEQQRTLRTAVNWTAAILIATVFLVAGIWKASDPAAAAVRLAQAKVPQSLSVAAALGLGIVETFTGILLLVPRFRRWGAWLGVFLLIAFMLYIGFYYNELRGAECSCFPWVKRAVGPAFFVGDGIMLALAALAGWGTQRSHAWKPALAVLGAVTVFAFVSFGVAESRHTGTRAPATITAANGKPISLSEGKVLIYFFDPACMHCVEAGRKLAAMHWNDTRLVGVPVATPQFADGFMKKTGLQATVSSDLALLKKTFPFESAPAAVAIENGYQKAALNKFEEAEPEASLKKIGFAK